MSRKFSWRKKTSRFPSLLRGDEWSDVLFKKQPSTTSHYITSTERESKGKRIKPMTVSERRRTRSAGGRGAAVICTRTRNYRYHGRLVLVCHTLQQRQFLLLVARCTCRLCSVYAVDYVSCETVPRRRRRTMAGC
jgi:hypothetical protein